MISYITISCLFITIYGFVQNTIDESSFSSAKCPCASSSPSKKCLSYDPRYMATSLDEALFSFPNLATLGGTPLFDDDDDEDEMAAAADIKSSKVSMLSVQTFGQSEPTKTAKTCKSPECLECKLAIVNGFLQNSSNSSNDVLWQTQQQLQGQINSPSVTCDRLKTRRKRSFRFSSKSNENRFNKLFDSLKNVTMDRKKRDDDDISETDLMLGVTSQIGCDYKKGTALSETDNWCGLCNLCWQWRRLPEEYFPNYINEVSCDTEDNSCLAGFGTCRPVIRVLNILKRVGPKESSKWEPITIESAAACECQVEVGTPLHALAQK
ncbi:unnamed protein product [Auanema sp. JU1783]|nr:unnamed protein product [Auanema sp. JU1783]